jgi:hypothetical protein
MWHQFIDAAGRLQRKALKHVADVRVGIELSPPMQN